MEKKDIKAVRQFLGLSQVEFAKLIGYSLPHYQKLESGERELTLKNYQRVAQLVCSSNFTEKWERMADLREELKRYQNI